MPHTKSPASALQRREGTDIFREKRSVIFRLVTDDFLLSNLFLRGRLALGTLGCRLLAFSIAILGGSSSLCSLSLEGLESSSSLILVDRPIVGFSCGTRKVKSAYILHYSASSKDRKHKVK
jgi:hypothetical protein